MILKMMKMILSAQDKSSGRWVFYPTSQTIDHERNPDKYYNL